MIWKIGIGIASVVAIAFVIALCKVAAESDRRMREMERHHRHDWKGIGEKTGKE